MKISFRRAIAGLGMAVLLLTPVGAAPSETKPQDELSTPPIYQPRTEDAVVPPPVTLPPPPHIPAEVPNAPLSADEAARIALRYQPTIGIARGQITTARGTVTAAGAPSRTIFNMGLNYIDVLTPSTGGSSSAAIATAVAQGANQAALGGGAAGNAALQGAAGAGYLVTGSVRQLLYDFNRTREQVRQARAAERAAVAGLTTTQTEVVLQTKRAYYAYVQALRTILVNEGNLRNQQDHLALARGRFRAGVGLPADVVRSQTAVSSAIFNLVQARNNASLARVQLAAIMGIDPRTPINIQEDSHEPEPATDSVEALFGDALKRRPEMAQSLSNVEAAEHGLKAARLTNAPTLSGTLTYTARGSSLFPSNDSVIGGVQLSWSPLDGDLTKGATLQAQGVLETARASLLNARQTVLSEVGQAYLNLKTAEQALVTADAEVANAEETARLNVGRYKSGLGQLLDVLDAQNALNIARTNRVNAAAGVDLARAALQRAIGTPLGEDPGP